MRVKNQIRSKKKNLPAVQKPAPLFWKELRQLARNRVVKTDLFRLLSQMNEGLTTLLKKELPSVKIYIRRTQRKVDRFFIRQNRPSPSKLARKMDMALE